MREHFLFVFLTLNWSWNCKYYSLFSIHVCFNQFCNNYCRECTQSTVDDRTHFNRSETHISLQVLRLVSAEWEQENLNMQHVALKSSGSAVHLRLLWLSRSHYAEALNNVNNCSCSLLFRPAILVHLVQCNSRVAVTLDVKFLMETLFTLLMYVVHIIVIRYYQWWPPIGLNLGIN